MSSSCEIASSDSRSSSQSRSRRCNASAGAVTLRAAARAPRRAPRARARRRRRSRPAAGADPRVEAGERAGAPRVTRCGERRVDRRVFVARLRPRARPARGPLGGAHRHALRDDLAREPAALVVVRDGEHRAGVALGAARRARPSRARRRAARAAAAGSRSSASSGRRARRPRRARARTRRSAPRSARASSTGERFSRATFSTRPSRSVSRSSASRIDRRHGRDARLAGRAPAALAGDQLVAAVRARGRTTTGWMSALRADRVGEPGASPRGRSACAAGAGSRWICSTGRCASSGSPAPPIRTSKPRPRPRRGVLAALDKLHRHLPVGLGAARAPVVVRSPAARGSAPRRRAPSAARRSSKTSSPKCRRTSRSTSAARRVRPSTIVIRTPAIASRGLSRALIEVDRLHELREALERVVLGLHRHDHAVGRGERVDGQRPERRRAVEEDEVEAVGVPRAPRRGSARRRRGARARPRRPRARASTGRGRGSRTRVGFASSASGAPSSRS